MPAHLLTYRLQKLVAWILLLQLINLSVDLPGIRLQVVAGQAQKQALVNDTQTVYELIAEGVFGDEVPETDDPEIEKSPGAFVLFPGKPSLVILAPQVHPLVHYSSHRPFFPACYPDTDRPPPKQGLS